VIDEGWGGKCGNNEVTCNIPGFGSEGIISFDWKHFPYEDYDQWLWGESGLWTANEEALANDGPPATVGGGTVVRLTRLSLAVDEQPLPFDRLRSRREAPATTAFQAAMFGISISGSGDGIAPLSWDQDSPITNTLARWQM
jgi:hypothetical protein